MRYHLCNFDLNFDYATPGCVPFFFFFLCRRKTKVSDREFESRRGTLWLCAFFFCDEVRAVCVVE